MSEDDGTCVEDEVLLVEDELNQTAQTLTTASEIAVVIGISLAAIVSLMNLSAPIAMWMIANQIQLVSLLLLTGAYLPPSIKGILTGSQFTSFSFSFIPVMDTPGINILLKSFDIEQEDVNLQEMGLNSGSTITSNSTFLFMIIVLIMLHLFSLLIPKCRQRDDEGRSSRLCRKFRNFIDSFMGFTIYVRLFIEFYQYMLLSSISELNEKRISTTQNLISLIFAGVVLTTCLLVVLFIIVMTFNNRHEL